MTGPPARTRGVIEEGFIGRVDPGSSTCSQLAAGRSYQGVAGSPCIEGITKGASPGWCRVPAAACDGGCGAAADDGCCGRDGPCPGSAAADEAVVPPADVLRAAISARAASRPSERAVSSVCRRYWITALSKNDSSSHSRSKSWIFLRCRGQRGKAAAAATSVGKNTAACDAKLSDAWTSASLLLAVRRAAWRTSETM